LFCKEGASGLPENQYGSSGIIFPAFGAMEWADI